MNQTTDGVDIDRRTVLRGVGAVAVTGALAGCGGGGDNGGDDGDDGDNGGADVPSEVDDYLSDANNYDGSAVDETGSSSVTVDVGAGDGFAYDPAAVIVDSGTTVTWEWVQGSHNVVHDVEASSQSEQAFNSGSATTSGPFEHTFDETGNFLYYCTPHQAQGMLGAVIVE